jgi:ATP:ADP antiporter, AAA family
MTQPSNAALTPHWLQRFVPVERTEIAIVLLASSMFFCLFAGYFAVRPIRETVGTLLGREQVADLWVITWIASLGIVPLYGWFVSRVPRSVCLPALYGTVAVAFLILAAVFDEALLGQGVAKFFYVFISVLNLFLVSVFWSFLLEIFDREQAKRLFAFIAAGGTAGALVGPLISDFAIGVTGSRGLMLLAAALFGAAIILQRVLLASWRKQSPEQSRSADAGLGGNPFAGFMLVLRSPYLLGIASFIVLVSTVNTFLYFEQLRLVTETFPDVTDRTRVFARLDWIVQALTILAQLFITSRIASRFGVTTLLTIVPIGMILGFLLLASHGSFAVLAVVFVMRRVSEYAFIRPGREMLYSPLDKESKYKAKNVNDVPVYRGADAMAAQLTTGLSAAGLAPAMLSVLGAGVAFVWALVAWGLGHSFDRRSRDGKAVDRPMISRRAAELSVREKSAEGAL